VANNFAITTIPVLTGTPGPGGALTQAVCGGGWQTTFVLVNTGSGTSQAQLSFFDDQGSPLSMPLTIADTGNSVTATSMSETLAGGSTLTIVSPPTGAPLSGWASLSVSGSVGGFAIFRYNPSGQEAGVPLEARTASSYFLAFDNTGGVSTGVALANVSSNVADIPVVIRDDAGFSLGTATIDLAARGHTSFMLADSYPVTTGKRGTIEFDTPAGGQISALGLRAAPTGVGSNFAITTLPVLAK
jgi:hypothetical protein